MATLLDKSIASHLLTKLVVQCKIFGKAYIMFGKKYQKHKKRLKYVVTVYSCLFQYEGCCQHFSFANMQTQSKF